jgi:hypothetical protein
VEVYRTPFKGSPVYHIALDPRTGTMLAAVNNDFQGSRIAKSRDLGRTWKRGGSLPDSRRGRS